MAAFAAGEAVESLKISKTLKVSDRTQLRFPGNPRRSKPALATHRFSERHPGSSLPVQQRQLPVSALHYRQQSLQQRVQALLRE
ncbi:uncharacterized, partial [Tachysurus ichikawai]